VQHRKLGDQAAATPWRRTGRTGWASWARSSARRP